MVFQNSWVMVMGSVTDIEQIYSRQIDIQFRYSAGYPVRDSA